MGEAIYHNKVEQRGKYIAMAGTYLLITVPAVLFLDHNGFVILAMNGLMYMVLFRGNFISRIAHFVSVYLLINLVESFVFGIGAVLLRPSLEPMEVNPIRSGEFSLLLAVVITISILYIVNRKRTQNLILYFRSLNRLQALVIAAILWSGILLLGSITGIPKYTEDKNENGILLGLTIIFMGAVLSGVILWAFNAYGKSYYLEQSKIKEEIIHVQQIHCQNVCDNDREMRKFRHDMNSQLRFLELLLADGKTEDALRHLQKMGNHFEELTIPKYHTGNEILDVLISQKAQEAKERGIDLAFEGRMDKPDFMDTFDLCTLFSNALDNSIEACGVVGDQKGVVTVCVLTHENTVLFVFKNPATAEMYQALKQGGTTKADRKNHGFGVENIRRVVNRKEGEINYYFKDGELTIEIYFEV